MFVCTNTLASCGGHFVNPVKDVCWNCLFPISIGGAKVVDGKTPDTRNPSTPIEMCKIAAPPYYRVGLNIGFWEPFALTDVTPDPYCMVNLGGVKLNIGSNGYGGRQIRDPQNTGGFYYVHWYKYPLVYWLQLITSMGCMQTGEFDISYLTELDPTWNDDELATILNPEAVLFGNMVAQSACALDAIKSQFGLPIDSLFWCAGTQGGMYPLTGTVFDVKGPISASILLSERMAFKMHREGLVLESSPDAGTGVDGPICHQYYTPILPKSRYRYQMTNTVSDSSHCYQFGHMAATWEAGHNYPGQKNQFGFLIWRKRNCTFL